MICDYCDQPATLVNRDATDEVLCKDCAREQGYERSQVSALGPRALAHWAPNRV